MSYRVMSSVHENFGMLGSEDPPHGVPGTTGKPQQCFIFPAASSTVVAECLERRNKEWFVRADVENDLIVQIGDSSFHLHKIPMVSKSGYINRCVFDRRIREEQAGKSLVRIESFPGGTKIFELVVKFCYGWRVHAASSNIAPLHCAANFLEMSEDLESGNLLSKTEAFLSFLIFSSWKDTFCVLKTCESVTPWAEEFLIVQRCTEAIAWKASMNQNDFYFRPEDESHLKHTRTKSLPDNWWLEDVSGLRIDHFVDVIKSLKREGTRPKLVGLCIAHWTTKWFKKLTFGLGPLVPNTLNHRFQQLTVENLIRVLPSEENSVSCNFILHLYKLGRTMKSSSELLENLEKRVASVLDTCNVEDLLVKNCMETKSVYDVSIVSHVAKSYVSYEARKPGRPVSSGAKLVDEYLTRVARDRNLTVGDFQSLVQALPRNARTCDDNLYRAIDMFLKAHPDLTEEERVGVTRAMDPQKLSREGRKHAMMNGRLPAETVARMIFIEQVYMTRSLAASGSDDRRMRTQAIIRSGKGCERGRRGGVLKDIEMMKKEVEKMKVQIHDLQVCRLDIQRQAKRCVM